MRYYPENCGDGGGGQGAATGGTATARIWMSKLDRQVNYGGAVDNLGQFVYVGFLPPHSVLGYAECLMQTVGGATAPAELGVFSSTLAGSGLGTMALAPLVTVTVFAPNLNEQPNLMHRNATAFAVTLADWTHCWTGFRQAIIGGVPGWIGVRWDQHAGLVRNVLNCPALTSTDTFFAFTVSGLSLSAAVAPDFRLRLI